jgi:hypothetical protein
MKKRFLPQLICLLLITSLFLPHQTDSANLTVVKDTLQSSRISNYARVDAASTFAGSSTVVMKTVASAPANTISTANFRIGDSLVIGTGTYSVVGIFNASEFTVSPVLAAGDADDNDPIYLKSKPQHVVTFNTASAIANGYFRVLIPADATTPNDGNPDDGGFDFGGGTITVAGSSTATAAEYTFVTGVATASGGTGCTSPANYHCFEVHYSGTGGVGKAITINIGETGGANSLIAPAPGGSHTEATADTYTFITKNYNDIDVAIDQTSGKIAVIESVRVTATVDPTISFSIAGIASAANPCGTGATNQTDIDTTTGTNAPLAVPFGTLGLNTFKDAAHLLTVSTNATNGYTVTAQENDQLGKDGGATPFIPDADGDAGSATETVTDTWDTASGNPGFGYTIKSVNLATVPFTSTGANFNVRKFPSVADPDSPLVATVMSSTGTADAHTANICYRISVDSTQAAGDYENQITYTATASF